MRRVATTTRGGGVAAWRQRWVPNGVVAHTLPYSSTATTTAITAVPMGRAGAPASSALVSVSRGWWRGPGSSASWSSLATVHRRRGVWAGAACGLLLVLPGGRHAVKAAAASQATDASTAAASSSSGPAVVRLYSPAVTTPVSSAAAETRFVLKQAFIQRRSPIPIIRLRLLLLPPPWPPPGRSSSSSSSSSWPVRDSTPLTAGLALLFLKPWLDFRAYQREASALRIDGRAVRFTGELVEYMKLTLWDAFLTVVTIGVYGVMGYPELNSARYFDTHLEWATTDHDHHDTDTKEVSATAPNQPHTTVGHV
ncbi:uncharacterized protein ACA1_320780 [Acanthamoeba castellanii str. Neff]|uniref:Uncharacterized protein n=1 Tax=Acanthamoeba castellanii (strain ATCC 30010 / Neff) TaxID=1257118 RepID=L8GT91_ACACF|nr:uncharacterized protein ACA1_320780 [Acanthamoeba castellanii str. Neff]ELR16414.1 hypothetical protein ACA1_320780 [Acanthamoeba castellanii str. Neff]